MLTPGEYRQLADQCDKLAGETDDMQEKAMLLRIADQWRRLANYRAKRERAEGRENSN